MHCIIAILSTWAKHGFAATDNLTYRKNALFMHQTIFIEEIVRTNHLQTSQNMFSRKDLEDGALAIDIFKNPFYAPQEIYRLALEAVEEKTREENRFLSDKEKQAIIRNFLEEKANTVDSQVIEGVAVGIAPTPVSKVMDLFLHLENFQNYVPNIFLNSVHITPQELKERGIIPLPHVEYQFSKIKIASVEFTHTLRYEITSYQKNGVEGKLVAWEMAAPKFDRDPVYPRQGVLMNNGLFMVEPYVQEDGTIDPTRSLILYHVYIKVDPLNFVMDILSILFRESEARSAIHALANALRKETR
ncbi:MAG: hypothetical protein HYY61_05665 [Deltaproteobacteria bacterium]|nr:hypothetical protein [Deltaproteobacteria bacterium]